MKAFYFENILIQQEDVWKRKKIVFTEDVFLPAHYLDWVPQRKIQADVFKMSPGKIYADVEFPLNHKSLLDHYVRRYLYKGASLLISTLELGRKADWKERYHHYCDELSGIAIDYLVVPKMNIKYLTPEMIRYFGIQKVPFILVYANQIHDLTHIPWGWLNQMQALVNIPIGCIKHPLSDLVIQALAESGFQTLPEVISNTPLSAETLSKTGISNKKGEIKIYNDTDFNLYVNSNQMNHYCQKDQVPYISVIRGNVVKLNQTIYDTQGFGEFCDHTLKAQFWNKGF
ncbi:hypothetical protein GWK91_06285 [Virgibacillus sp. MSP4-1]|uniref:hypothetical protein n=1 Tax=Virgibacillus sp. MSP4-1 TaxID=2700081 RepID=UPI0003A70A10|nr:hypothetical protein [Virgibacillus sp. MSP4-1]QHS22579.1 hypothetical protein GWK91_06285 [Virgibacillus sp. MSP4-1]